MPRVIICCPRLDVPFKNLGPVSRERGPIAPIRQHWLNFVQQLDAYHQSRGHYVKVVEKPLWQFDKECVTTLSKVCDLIYMPHKQKVDFNISDNMLYYAQTVFPWIFSVDPMGWGANMTVSPFHVESDLSDDLVSDLKKRIGNNQSKFAQPPRSETFPYRNYILFVCQLPHDETIKYHSDVSVEDALRTTLEFGQQANIQVIVKGHPVNPGSMAPLREIQSKFQNSVYVDDVSIHDCLHHCDVVSLVNSGVGFEALLHEKPIIQFGRSEYSQVTLISQANVESFAECYQMRSVNTTEYQAVIKNFLVHTIDSTNLSSYSYLDTIANV